VGLLPKGRLARAGVALVAAVAIIQLVPYGRSHTNPPVTGEPTWDSPATRKLVERACFDCHSHKTTWPWYSQVAPVSWLVQSDVDEAREHLNFSAWDKPQGHADDAAEAVDEGEMPPAYYSILHPEAQLSAAERAQLVRGLRASFPETKKGGAAGHVGSDAGGHDGGHAD